MKRTPLKRVSKKRNAELKEYRKLKAEYLARVPYCRICADEYYAQNRPEFACVIPPVIGVDVNAATEIHHKLPLGRGGKLCDVTIFLATCRRCHTRIHDNPKWAEENKYLLRTKQVKHEN